MSHTTDNENLNTEEKILLAAEMEFAEKGYAGARSTSIAQKAGVTHAMLHYYFRTKENLFETVIDRKTEAIRNIILSAVNDDSAPLFDKIRTAISGHIEYIARNPHLPKFLVNEVMSDPTKAEMLFGKFKPHLPDTIARLQKQIDDEAAKGQCRKVDARMLIFDILSMNFFAFLARPIAGFLFEGTDVNSREFIEMRKKDSIETIMSKLRP